MPVEFAVRGSDPRFDRYPAIALNTLLTGVTSWGTVAPIAPSHPAFGQVAALFDDYQAHYGRQAFA